VGKENAFSLHFPKSKGPPDKKWKPTLPTILLAEFQPPTVIDMRQVVVGNTKTVEFAMQAADGRIAQVNVSVDKVPKGFTVRWFGYCHHPPLG